MKTLALFILAALLSCCIHQNNNHKKTVIDINQYIKNKNISLYRSPIRGGMSYYFLELEVNPEIQDEFKIKEFVFQGIKAEPIVNENHITAQFTITNGLNSEEFMSELIIKELETLNDVTLYYEQSNSRVKDLIRDIPKKNLEPSM